MTNRFIAFLLLAVFASAASAQERRSDNRQDHAGQFDFYVLSLSWSPTFCASQGGNRNDQQCSTDKDFRFIVHGLWPQYEKGYPDFCETKEPGRVPNSLGEPLFDIMPSMGLIGHQWRKHGSCTGLTQRDYFGKLREAFSRIKLPADLSRGDAAVTLSADQIEEKFITANPGMSRRGISTSLRRPQARGSADLPHQGPAIPRLRRGGSRQLPGQPDHPAPGTLRFIERTRP